MNRLYMIAAAAALALAGCTAGGALDTAAGLGVSSLPASPAAVADRTVLDEQGMLAVELAYKGARLAVETGVDAGLIKGATAAKFAALNDKAWAGVLAVRSAYRTGNAASYSAAIANARATVQQLLALAPKGN